jgi:hypothetical protein
MRCTRGAAGDGGGPGEEKSMTTARGRVASFSGLLLLGLLSASTVSGGTIYNFESCNTVYPTPIGVWNNGPPTGCDGWYTPTGPTAQGTVYPYSLLNQAFGITADPAGGNYVLGLTGNGSGTTQTYDRAQHDFTFSSAAAWTVTYDLSVFNGNSSGSTYDTNYIGGFSVLTAGFNSAQSAFIVDYAWDDSSASSTWSPVFWIYDANGDLLNPDGVVVWTGLSQNHWYSESTVFDEDSNRIVRVSITDLTANATATFAPGNWYMAGGAAGATSEPNDFRFSGLGQNNAVLVDNVSLSSVPEPATFLLMGAGIIALIAFRRRGRLSCAVPCAEDHGRSPVDEP